MGRRCERPGCSAVAAVAYGFDVDRLLVWLAPHDADGDPLRAGSLCRRHAEALVVPVRWTLDDRRESTPRLFRLNDPTSVRRRGGRRRDVEAPVEQPKLDASPAAALPRDGAVATAAVPRTSAADTSDDLGGALTARTPLLARAFLGTERRR